MLRRLRPVAAIAAIAVALGAAACTPGGTTDPRERTFEVVPVAGRLPDPSSAAVMAPVAVSSDGGIRDPAAGAATAARVTTPERRIVLAFTGDILPHTPLIAHAERQGAATGVAHDFRSMFAAVEPILSSVDLAVCHLETPVAPPGEAYSTAPIYGVPAGIAAGIAGAGYDRCSLASNHSLDRGTAGVVTTLDALDAVGVDHAGMARSPAEVAEPVLDVGGIGVAHLSYTWSFNGLPLPGGQPWWSNLIDTGRIIAEAADARARGAEVVVVSLHWGVEGSQLVSASQRSIAETLTSSGVVDLIVGHHAHVIQPIDLVNGRWVVFGLGNHLSNMPTGGNWGPPSQDGMIVAVEVTAGPSGVSIGVPMVVPTWVDRDGGWVITPVVPALADPTISDGRRALLEASLARTRAIVGPFVLPV